MTHGSDTGYLPMFKSPLLTEEEKNSLSQHTTHTSITSPVHARKAPQHHEGSIGSDDAQDEQADDDDVPSFRRHAEATNSELFYDLFFVANLTVFTNIHELNDITTFRQFVGFFAVLWMTWYQVSLYDVRFSSDSLFDRIAKAVQFGVMVGFAVIGPRFNVGASQQGGNSNTGAGEPPYWETFRALCLILMVSRLVLVFQYVQALFFVRKYKKTQLPLASIAGVYLVASIIYLSLFWAFKPTDSKAYIAWYIVALAETIIATGISTIWRIVSFKGTHLVQRMSLLTLIFLGEGIIVVAKKSQMVFGTSVFGPTPVNIGGVVCAILILYFLYMLYFDWIEEEHFGTIRQQIWAFLHFPLHLALVVGVVGVAQVFSFTAGYDAFNRFADIVTVYPINGTQTELDYAAKSLGKFVNVTQKATVKGITYSHMDDWYQARMSLKEDLADLRNITLRWEYRSVALGKLALTTGKSFFDIAGFMPPDTGARYDGDDYEKIYESAAGYIRAQGEVFALTFIYFFVAIGLVVVLIGVIAMLSKHTKTTIHWLRLVVNVVIGAVICLISTLAVQTIKQNSLSLDEYEELPSNSYDNFISSAWLLPTVTLLLFLAVLLNNIKIRAPWRPFQKGGQKTFFGHKSLFNKRKVARGNEVTYA